MPLLSKTRTLVEPTLWAALLLGSPYVIGMRPLGGSASFSLIYPLIAAAMLAGMWLTTRLILVDRNNIVMHTSIVVGVFATASLVIPEWLDLFLMGAGSNLESAVSLATAKSLPVPQVLYTFSSTLSLPLSLVAGLSYGIYVQSAVPQTAAPSNRSSRNQAQQRRSARYSTITSILLIGIGLLQPIAWTAWLPHGSFPLAPATSDAPLSSLTWETAAPLALVPLLEQIMICACALYISKCPAYIDCIASPQCARLPRPPFAALLIGIIAGSILVAAFPGLRIVSQGEMFFFAGIQVVLIAVLPVVINRANKQGPPRELAAPDNLREQSDSSSKPASVSGPYTDALLRYGLTNREASAVAGHLMGFSSSQTATILGIQASSVREYGRRACKKLGFSSMSEFKKLVNDHGPTHTESSHATIESKRDAHIKIVTKTISMASLAAVFLPIAGECMTGGEILATVGGALLGLMGTRLIKAGPVGSHSQCMETAAIRIILACMTVLLCACSLALRACNLPVQWGCGALMLCTAASVATGLAQFKHQKAAPHASCFAFALGWSWTLSWLTFLSMEPLSWVVIPALLLLGITLSAIAGQAESKCLSIGLAALAMAMLGFLTNLTSALLLLTTTLIIFIEDSPTEGLSVTFRQHAITTVTLPMLAMLGIITALVLFGAKLWLGTITTPWLASNTYSTIVIVFSCVITFVILIECWKAMAYLKHRREFPREIAPDDLQRMEGFLISKGLTPRQVHIALRTTQGASLGEIGAELNLSRTAVHTSRHEVLSILGVLDTDGLIRSLQKAIR